MLQYNHMRHMTLHSRQRLINCSFITYFARCPSCKILHIGCFLLSTKDTRRPMSVNVGGHASLFFCQRSAVFCSLWALTNPRTWAGGGELRWLQAPAAEQIYACVLYAMAPLLENQFDMKGGLGGWGVKQSLCVRRSWQANFASGPWRMALAQNTEMLCSRWGRHNNPRLSIPISSLARTALCGWPSLRSF